VFEAASVSGDEVTPQAVELKAGPIIEAFINEALQISVKG
jgi:hypothetical protein